MVSVVRKRLFFIFCMIAVLLLLVRVLLYNGSLLAATDNYRRAPGAPVLIMVFYEALCPDSKHFVLKQLLPAYREAAPLMEIQLVPYGKAETMKNDDGTYRFKCQHGQVECDANAYHACTAEAVENPLKRLEMIGCMIHDNAKPKSALLRCAKEAKLEEVDLIQKCFDSSHGADLLKLNGDATHALRPAVTFIPTITLDGSQGRQASILKNLIAEVCKVAGNTEQADELCKNHR